MASGNHISCGPCMFEDVTKDAGRWCTRCEEGLCDDCEKAHRKSKSSRNHQVISIGDYRKIEDVSISQVCEQHGENLEWFCKTHDEVLCVACVPSKHKACSDVIPISVNSANSRQSSALSELEMTIEGILRNVKQCIGNRESATKKLEKQHYEQELEVKTMVLETRTKLNGQLDKLQDKLLHELRSTSQTCKSKYVEILQKLKSTEEMLTKLREQTLHMKQFSSDIQVFLGTRQFNKRIVNEIDSIKDEIGNVKDYELKVSINSIIEKLVNDVENFGQIQVSEVSAKLDFRGSKIDQAQIQINVPGSRNIANIKLQCIRTFKMKMTNDISVRNCIILPNGHILMSSNTKENQLIEYSNTGELIQDIQVSAKLNDIAVIDPNRIVVTYGDIAFIEIMNSNTFNVEKKISIQDSCMGISHSDGKLYVVCGQSTIKAIDLAGAQLETFKMESIGLYCFKTSREKIFYADYDNRQVFCCRLNGEELWKFECDSIIIFPYDITIDSYNNVYVVDSVCNNLIIIQHDGKDSKTLLSECDGLNSPQFVDFDKDSRTLIVCNKDGWVAMFSVV